MFRTREDFRFHVPRQLLNGDNAVAHYRVFERLLKIPLFMVSVFSARDGEEECARWQTFFLQEVQEVMQLVAMEFWSAHKIYVILPERVTGRDREIMASCNAIWKCQEDGWSEAIWVFDTDQGRFSHGGNQPLTDIDDKKTLIWRQSSSDDVEHSNSHG